MTLIRPIAAIRRDGFAGVCPDGPNAFPLPTSRPLSAFLPCTRPTNTRFTLSATLRASCASASSETNVQAP